MSDVFSSEDLPLEEQIKYLKGVIEGLFRIIEGYQRIERED
jgi:hypothetical protein